MAAEILQVARAQLAEVGPPGLLLRAVAREMGTAPSTPFRYPPHKDVPPTELIIAGYDALGEAAEAAAGRDARRRPRPALGGDLPSDPRHRHSATPRSTRSILRLARARLRRTAGHRRSGDADPRPAHRAARRRARGRPDRAGVGPHGRPRLMHAAIAPVRATIPPSVPDELVVRGLIAWTHLFGAVSFEVFGHPGPSTCWTTPRPSSSTRYA